MVRELVPDVLLERVTPLLPVAKKKLGRGRPRADSEAIVFVSRTGIPWERLPTKQFGSSWTTA